MTSINELDADRSFHAEARRKGASHWLAADVPTIQPSAPHAGRHPFDDQAALKFDDGPTITTMARPSGPPVSGSRRPSTAGNSAVSAPIWPT